MSQQQTVLRVRTNVPSEELITGTTTMSISGSSPSVIYSGSGTSDIPYVGTFGTGSTYVELGIAGNGVLNYDITLYDVGIGSNFLQAFVKHPGEQNFRTIFTEFYYRNVSTFDVIDGDTIAFKQAAGAPTGGTFEFYVTPDVVSNSFEIEQYDFLDLYDDIPLTINRSFAELQDISKRNSDYSIGIKLPGSKKNNRFFENFFNVDSASLYFDVTKKVQCQVLLNNEAYFTGYMKLNSTSVQNSKIEYDITLFSNVGDLYGKIGNNLLRDLNFRDVDHHFNHVFSRDNVLKDWRYETLKSTQPVPSTYFYPVIHNGYNYRVTGDTSLPQYVGVTGNSLYTTTKLGSWPDLATAYAAGVEQYRINSPEDGVRDNQLKPALNLWSLIKLMFKTYGYTIKSDFMTTPWMKLLYMYGYYSNDTAKFSYKTPATQVYSLEGVEVLLVETFVDQTVYCDGAQIRTTRTYTIYVVKKGTGIPVLCNQPINLVLDYRFFPCGGSSYNDYQVNVTIPSNTTGTTYSWVSNGPAPIIPGSGTTCPCDVEYQQNFGVNTSASNVGVSSESLAYMPLTQNTVVQVSDGTYIDFSLIIDENIKQLDVLSSIAKKFNLVFIPDPVVPNQIIIESYPYYVGTGNVYDWTDKLSWDKGFTVQPALNFVETELILTDAEDGDSLNKTFKESNQNRIYGQKIKYNPTEFKPLTKKIETTFSPEIIRKWNPNYVPYTGVSNDVGIPLGVNYVESSQETDGAAKWIYKGVKTKPKLMFNLGNYSPFLDKYQEEFNITGVTTSYFRVNNSNGTSPSGGLISPVISHTMPMGNPDINKTRDAFENDSICILFQSEQPVSVANDSISLFNVFTNNDMYSLFYQDRVDNAFDKNTRFLSGFFELKLSDVKSLQATDLIKINEQYFTWNKIDAFNLTNRELTKVELIQTNYNPQTYPTRYFNYQYCVGDTTTVYKFKTEFIGANSIYESFYYYSILYDYFCGALGASETNLVSGYTTSFGYTGGTYMPYSIWEVNKTQYDAGGTLYTNDPQRYFFLLSIEEEPLSSDIFSQQNSVWLINSSETKARLNVFTGCTDFLTTASSMGVSVAGSASGSTLTSGATLNVTDTGWIKYDDNASTNYVYIGSTGTYTLNACAKCDTIRVGIPLADLANFTITSCGNTC
jgi:hypothetical protein